MEPNKKLTLCNDCKCCPVIENMNNGTITITDDDGNVVKMTTSQYLFLLQNGHKVI